MEELPDSGRILGNGNLEWKNPAGRNSNRRRWHKEKIDSIIIGNKKQIAIREYGTLSPHRLETRLQQK
jgi:ribosomal protein L32E